MTEHSREPFTKEKLIQHLLYGRDEYSEEIPSHTLHSTDGNFKIRTGWFMGVATGIEYGLESGVIPDTIKKDVQDFLYWYNHDFRYKPGNPRMNTREDIEKGNEIIDKVLASFGVKPKEIKK